MARKSWKVEKGCLPAGPRFSGSARSRPRIGSRKPPAAAGELKEKKGPDPKRGSDYLHGAGDGVLLDVCRLPHKRFVRVANPVVHDVDAEVLAARGVFLPQLVEYVRGVKPSILRDHPRDDLQRFGKRVDHKLLLARDSARMRAQDLAQLHLNRAAARPAQQIAEQTIFAPHARADHLHNVRVLHRPPNDADCVVQRAVGLATPSGEH